MATVQEIRERLRNDGAYYAEHCLKLHNEDGQLVPLHPKLGQRKIERAIQAQYAAGEPIRLIVLKSRRCGSSTWVVGTGVRYLTQQANRRGQIVAHDNGTAAELFDVASTMYANLPDEEDLKPPVISNRTAVQKWLHWGEPSKIERLRGNVGINSTLSIDTAKEVDAGRGKTISFLHATEVAYWPDPRKALGLLNAVFDRPNTYAILESTANGFNFFKERWDRAARGEGGYSAVFISWLEDENCVRAFESPDERQRFIETIGSGEWGAEEPELIERYGATPEQLNWRRFAIVDKCDGKLELFRQEYPSNPAEAFVGSGRHVFSVVFVGRCVARAEAISQVEPKWGGPQEGILKETATKTRRIHDGSIEVPTGSLWVPSEGTGFPYGYDFWTRWTPNETEEPHSEAALLKPDPAGQYLIAVDPASGEPNTSGDEDFHAIQVIDHKTKDQVARLHTKTLDSDELSFQALLAALFYNQALISVETTGGYGVAVVRKLWDAYGYRRLYKRKAIETGSAKASDRLGWDTNRRSKPLMVEGLREMLREGTHGIRDVKTALELTTYITDDKGRQRADASAHDDLLSAYMQGQEVARETRLRPDSAGSGPASTWVGERRPW